METGARWRNLSLFIALTAVSLIIPLVIRHNSDKRDKNISDQLKKESRTKLLQRLWGGKFVFTLVPFQYEHRLADSIFFVETNDKLSQISAKILCAFESAALKNPDKRIAVVLNSASDLQFAPILHSEIVNLHFYKVNYSRLTEGLPIDRLWKSGDLHREKCSRKHFAQLSDVVRNSLLYKFGGGYSDTDVISLKQFPEGHFTVFQDAGSINNAVMKFGKNHPFVKSFMEKQAANWEPSGLFSITGPLAMTQTAITHCKAVRRELKWWMKLINIPFGGEVVYKPALTNVDCPDLAVLPVEKAYPINYNNWKDFYDPQKLFKVKSALRDSNFVHYWNSMKQNGFLGYTKDPEIIVLEADQPWYYLAKEHCPHTENRFLRYLTGLPL